MKINKYYLVIYIKRGKPTRLAPRPKPAPERAETAIDGMYVSRIAKVAAAVNANNTISSKTSAFLGIINAATATIRPSTKYLMARLNISVKSKSSVI